METAPRRGRPKVGLIRAAAEKANQEALEANQVGEVQEERPEMRAEQRPEMRAPMREEDPRTRAARRSAEIKNHIGNMDEGPDDFYVDSAAIPPGWSYEWKRKLNVGAEDPAYQVQLKRMGWEEVPASRHPSYMPTGNKNAYIERKGMVLMERPLDITQESRQIELKKARNQVRQKEQQLNSAPDGQFGRDHEQVKPRINKSYEAISIPE